MVQNPFGTRHRHDGPKRGAAGMNDTFDGELDIGGCIRPDGSLGGDRVLRRETLYVGLNGNRVERFWDSRRSYIYKPVGFPKTAGRERWVARHLKPHLGGIRIPEIVAASDDAGQPGARAWLIVEDLGELRPPRTAADAAEAASWAAVWHRLPVSLVPASFAGHTPPLEEVAQELGRDRAAVGRRLARAGTPGAAAWAARLPDLPGLVPPLEAVCHGDYYPGNIAMNFAGPVVLDWEFVHRNHPYWDLYCLMDITSFRYRKIPMTNRARIKALKRYLDALADKPAGPARQDPPPEQARPGPREQPAPAVRERKASSRVDPSQPLRSEPADRPGPHRSDLADGAVGDAELFRFARGYAAYAAVYSAWILGLIEKDLAAGRAARRLLERQWRETAGVLNDCLALLGAPG